MKQKVLITLAALLLLATPGAWSDGFARDWSDLDEEERRIFGSEKEEKYDINAFFVEKESWENHESLMVFWLYKAVDYPRYRSLRVLPFWYRLDSKIDNRRKTVIPLFLYYNRRDGEQRLTACPLYFSRLDSRSYDRSLLYLFWWGKTRGEQSTASWFFIPPVYHKDFHRERKWYDRTSTEEGSTWISPLWYSKYYLYDHANVLVRNRTMISPLHYYSSHEEKTADRKTLTWWAPLVPLTYHHTSSSGGHRNFLWLVDYSWSRADGADRLERFWFIPLLFRKPGVGGYTHVLPPVFMRFKTAEDEHYTHIFPLYARWKSSMAFYREGENRWDVKYTGGTLTPLFGHVKHTAGPEKWEGERYGRTFWFPLLPLFYRSSDTGEGNHVNLLWLLDWRTGPDGSLKRFWLIPLVFHEAGPGGYRYYFPFYMKRSGWSKQDGASWSLFYYHRWGPGEKTLWIGPHYYHYSEKEKKKTNLWAPLYWHAQSPEREFTLFLPFYFSYASPRRALNINILGLSKSIAAGPSPVAGVGVGRSEQGWYFDTDVSWLYDMASLSTRVTLGKKPVIADLEGGEAADGKLNGEPEERVALTDKKSAGRETSFYFWGFHLLFGLVAYEQADSHRHFRLLPLSWLSWDKKSGDRVQWFLNYLNYRSGETGYLVFFPFYGAQRQGASYRKGYLLTLYWSEYDDREKLREHTVLWPFVNWYHSPAKSGWRFFPFIWHKRFQEGDREITRTISPLYYGSAAAGKESYYAYRASISPFHRYRVESTAGEDSLTLWFPVLPLVYYSRDRAYRQPKIDMEKSVTTFATRPVLKSEEVSSFVFPLYYWSRKKAGDGEPERRTERFMLAGLPLLYYSRELRTAEPDVQGQRYTRRASSFFLLGYYRHIEPRHYHSNFLLGLYWYTRQTYENRRSLTLLYGIFHRSSAEERRYTRIDGKYQSRPVEVNTSWLFPLYYTKRRDDASSGGYHKKTLLTPLWGTVRTDPGEGAAGPKTVTWAPIIPLSYFKSEPGYRHWNILGILDRQVDTGGTMGSTRFWLLPLFYTSTTKHEKTRFVLGLYLHRSDHYERQNFMLLYDHRLDSNRGEESYGALLGLARYRVTPEVKQFKLAYGLLMNYRNYREGPDYSFNVLWFLYSQKRSDDYFRTSLMPLWYYGRDDRGWDLCLPPLLTYVNDRGDEGKFQMWALGAFWYRNYRPRQHRDRRALLLGIPYYRVEKPERGYASTGSLWGLLWEYETESETNFSKFSLLKFLYKRVDMNGEVSHRVMGIRF
ncbi:MAG TPA: hypothetical protein ENN21_04735 [Spirochaetes bacterium]|nr:hypothetical protein [Spirochaetota bacterium]